MEAQVYSADASHLAQMAADLFESERAGHLAGVQFIGNPHFKEASFFGPNGQRPTLGNRRAMWFANKRHSKHLLVKEALKWQ